MTKMPKEVPTPWTATANSWQFTTIYDASGSAVCRFDLEDWGVTEETQERLEQMQADVVAAVLAAVNDRYKQAQPAAPHFEDDA
jgi:hypothetical protein